MRRRALTIALVVLLAGVVITATSAGDVPLVSGPPTLGWHVDLGEPPEPIEMEVPTEPIAPPELGDPSEPSGLLTTIVMVILVLIAVVVLTLIGVQLWRNRPRLNWRRQQPVTDFDVLAEAAEAIAADAAAQRAALLSGTPRNAIVECWARLEAAVASAGVPRRVSDTSTELTERVLTSSLVDPTAIGPLSALYREARFSSHPMGEAERQAAIDALDAVHAGLRAGVGADAAVPSDRAESGTVR